MKKQISYDIFAHAAGELFLAITQKLDTSDVSVSDEDVILASKLLLKDKFDALNNALGLMNVDTRFSMNQNGSFSVTGTGHELTKVFYGKVKKMCLAEDVIAEDAIKEITYLMGELSP